MCLNALGPASSLWDTSGLDRPGVFLRPTHHQDDLPSFLVPRDLLCALASRSSDAQLCSTSFSAFMATHSSHAPDTSDFSSSSLFFFFFCWREYPASPARLAPQRARAGPEPLGSWPTSKSVFDKGVSLSHSTRRGAREAVSLWGGHTQSRRQCGPHSLSKQTVD